MHVFILTISLGGCASLYSPTKPPRPIHKPKPEPVASLNPITLPPALYEEWLEEQQKAWVAEQNLLAKETARNKDLFTGQPKTDDPVWKSSESPGVRAARFLQAVPEGSFVEQDERGATTAEGIARLGLDWGTQVFLSPATEVGLQTQGATVPFIRLERGHARFWVATQQGPALTPRHPYRVVIQTPHGWIASKGVDFWVQVFVEKTIVRVLRGEVRLALKDAGLKPGAKEESTVLGAHRWGGITRDGEWLRENEEERVWDRGWARWLTEWASLHEGIKAIEAAALRDLRKKKK